MIERLEENGPGREGEGLTVSMLYIYYNIAVNGVGARVVPQLDFPELRRKQIPRFEALRDDSISHLPGDDSLSYGSLAN